MSRSKPDEKPWAPPLAEGAYLARRLQPSPAALDYLPLRDLRAVVEEFSRDVAGVVLDYGCGGAPYRPIFAHCERYLGADIVPGPEVEIVLDEQGRTGQPDGSFDAVLSWQVLEHVPAPDRYLAEAYRVLRPGGYLLLTTHGMFLEHGCPNDFFRWTGHGLARLVATNGFEVLRAIKITPGARASAHLVHTGFAHLRSPRGLSRLVALAISKTYAAFLRAPANLLTDRLESRAHVPFDAPEAIYIGVGLVARKPEV